MPVERTNALAVHLVPLLRRRGDHAGEIVAVHIGPLGALAVDGVEQGVDGRPPLLVELQLVQPRLMTQGVRHQPAQPFRRHRHGGSSLRTRECFDWTSRHLFGWLVPFIECSIKVCPHPPQLAEPSVCLRCAQIWSGVNPTELLHGSRSSYGSVFERWWLACRLMCELFLPHLERLAPKL